LPAKGLKTSSPFLPPRATRELRPKRNCFRLTQQNVFCTFVASCRTTPSHLNKQHYKRDILSPLYSVFKMLTWGITYTHTYVFRHLNTLCYSMTRAYYMGKTRAFSGSGALQVMTPQSSNIRWRPNVSYERWYPPKNMSSKPESDHLIRSCLEVGNLNIVWYRTKGEEKMH
jgi:hypothetical protein